MQRAELLKPAAASAHGTAVNKGFKAFRMAHRRRLCFSRRGELGCDHNTDVSDRHLDNKSFSFTAQLQVLLLFKTFIEIKEIGKERKRAVGDHPSPVKFPYPRSK